jgi:hypothetical protein
LSATDQATIFRRRERMMKLLAKVHEMRGARRETVLGVFGVSTGLSEKTILSYYHQLKAAGMIEEKMEEGIVFVAMPDYWQDNGKEEKKND